MPNPTREICIAGLGALALFGALDCSSDFDPYNRLTSLRVLALRSEPAVAAPDETATYSALVYAPSPGDVHAEDPTLTYEWQWCPFSGTANDGYPCLVTEDQVNMVLMDPTLTVSFALGNGPTATLRNPAISTDLQERLCDGKNGLPKIDCTGGFPIQIVLTVRTDTDTVRTVFRTRLGFGPGDANANPTLSALSATVDGAEQSIDAANSNGVMLVRDRETNLALDPSVVAQSETYQGLDDNGNPAQLQERLFVSWFVETGDTKDASTGYIPGMTQESVLLQNRWTPGLEKKFPATTARIYLVLRDNRNGVDWSMGQVNLVNPPEPTP